MNKPCHEKPRPTLYHMKLVFLVDASVIAVNKFTEMIDGSRVIAKNAFFISMEQTVAFIPTSEQIKEYEKILFEGLQANKSYRPEKVTFSGYKYIYPINEE